MNHLNGSHLSASAREILRLRQTIADLELAQQEYSALLNYLIVEGGGRFVMEREKTMKLLPLRGVKSEADPFGMTFTFVEDAPPVDPPKIITLG
jgi:hypothetical protein